MQMVMLGTLSLSGPAGVLAMRRKLLVVAQRLGFSAGRSTRLAASASDYAKTVIERGPMELRVLLNGEGGHIAKPIDPDQLFKTLLCWTRRRNAEETLEQSLGS
jgi:hypothetical protein